MGIIVSSDIHNKIENTEIRREKKVHLNYVHEKKDRKQKNKCILYVTCWIENLHVRDDCFSFPICRRRCCCCRFIIFFSVSLYVSTFYSILFNIKLDIWECVCVGSSIVLYLFAEIFVFFVSIFLVYSVSVYDHTVILYFVFALIIFLFVIFNIRITLLRLLISWRN